MIKQLISPHTTALQTTLCSTAYKKTANYITPQKRTTKNTTPHFNTLQYTIPHSTSLANSWHIIEPHHTIPHRRQNTVHHNREHRITHHIPLQCNTAQHTKSHITGALYAHITVHHSPRDISADLTTQWNYWFRKNQLTTTPLISNKLSSRIIRT